MSRPIKLGLDYFPLDVKDDEKLELFQAECGVIGFGILIKLWQKIYFEGYYIDWQDDNILLFARKINTDINLINEVINACLRRKLFDKTLYEKYKILTSKGIQKRYIEACKKSKRKTIEFIKDYYIAEKEQTEFITEFIELTPELTNETQEESAQSKGKKRKVKNIYTDENLVKEYFDLKFNRLLELEEPLTQKQLANLINKYNKEEVYNTLSAMENYKKLTQKNTSANLTCQNWIRRRQEQKPQSTGPEIKLVKNGKDAY